MGEALVQETQECRRTWKRTSQAQALSLQTSGLERLDQLSQEATRPHRPRDQRMVRPSRQIQDRQPLTGLDLPTLPLKTQTLALEEVLETALQCALQTHPRYSRAV